VIPVFVSRPNWTPPVIEYKLTDLYGLIQENGFSVKTVGKTQASLQSPFDEVRELMTQCRCAIVLGLPFIFIENGRIKHTDPTKFTLSTEWNQIEATVSLMLGLPTMVLLHHTVAPRGIFERGAANLFITDFDVMKRDWVEDLRLGLKTLRSRVDA
jgi:hypothetical protein